MYYVERMPNAIMIGRVGENNFRNVQIDLTEWMTDMPGGVPSIIIIRPTETDADAYIAATTFSNNILTWVVTSSDTEKEGTGTIQIWLEEADEDGQIVKRSKSVIVAIRIYESITGENTNTPAPQVPWMEQMNGLKTETVTAKNAALVAQGKAEDAQEAAEIAAGIAIAQAGQIKFFLDNNGHLIFAYTDQVPVNEEGD